jgi:hypothetical protein
MEVTRRILREFWLPALIAMAWTGFNVVSARSPWDLRTIVNVFAPSFFLASWATGQFFRVQKQVTLEKNLTGIEVRISKVVERLEKQSEDLLGYAKGGHGWPRFMPVFPADNTFELMILNESSYPVFDVQARLIDLDEPVDPTNGKLWTNHWFVLPSLYPNKAVMGAYRMNLSGKQRLRLNVFIQTRSAGLVQEFRIERAGNWYSIASRTKFDGTVVEHVADDFPGRDPSNLSRVFEQ